MMRCGGLLMLMALLCSPVAWADAADVAAWSGRDVMHNSMAQHDRFPFVFEVQSMILVDEDGHRDTRQLKRYSRVEKDGTIKILLRFTEPALIRGSAMLAVVNAQGESRSQMFLPALVDRLIEYRSTDRNGTFLGSDFSVGDLLPDAMDDYRYQRQADLDQGDDSWFVVEALPASKKIEQATGYSKRILFIRKDNMMIDRIDFFSHGMRIKQMSRHDLRRIHGGMWAANMVLMESFQQRHRSMLKTLHRTFGKDFVPPSMFEPQQILDLRGMH